MTISDGRPRLAGYDPTNPAEFIDPYQSWARARTEAPVFFDDRLGFWQLTRYEDVVAALMDTERFSSTGVFGAGEVYPENQHLLSRGFATDAPSLANADPPVHTRVRRMCSEPFRAKRIRHLEPIITEMADELIDAFAPDGHADLVDQFNMPLPLRVIAMILGLPATDIHEMARYSEEMVAYFNSMLSVEEQREVLTHYGTFYEFCETAIQRARAGCNENSLLADLVALVEADRDAISDPELVSSVAIIIVAGNETTRNLISNMLLTLFRHPEQLDAVRRQPELASAAVEETLRYRTSVKGLFRLTTEDVKIRDVLIPKGSVVQMGWGAANHDDTVFDRPEEFNIHRTDTLKHLGFSKGPHSCLGSALARLEATIALQRLLARLPDLRMAREPEFPADYLINPAISGLTRLNVAWTVSDKSSDAKPMTRD
jgi:cytochrome P450